MKNIQILWSGTVDRKWGDKDPFLPWNLFPFVKEAIMSKRDKEIDDHMRQVEARGTQPKPKPPKKESTK